jgi:hypothetical protein
LAQFAEIAASLDPDSKTILRQPPRNCPWPLS